MPNRKKSRTRAAARKATPDLKRPGRAPSSSRVTLAAVRATRLITVAAAAIDRADAVLIEFLHTQARRRGFTLVQADAYRAQMEELAAEQRHARELQERAAEMERQLAAAMLTIEGALNASTDARQAADRAVADQVAAESGADQAAPGRDFGNLGRLGETAPGELTYTEEHAHDPYTDQEVIDLARDRVHELIHATDGR